MLIPLQEIDERSNFGNNVNYMCAELTPEMENMGQQIFKLAKDFEKLVADRKLFISPVGNSIRRPKGGIDGASHRSLGELAAKIYMSRRKRESIFGSDLFGEPAWDILLDLFVAQCRGHQISISSACIGAAVPPTTALRWITIMVDAGLIARFDDPADRRRGFLELTPKGQSAMAQYLVDYAMS